MNKSKDKTDFDKRLEKLEIQVKCLRKQVLDLENKKSYRDDLSRWHDKEYRLPKEGESDER